ncbi:MAG TPA: rod shape-determining protein MreC [Candidatus Binatia bacterium]|jgi:rod shape-determining protein MreC|nr:rod shape-determining protein MreC [Candidatus Binatia bacterium]
MAVRTNSRILIAAAFGVLLIVLGAAGALRPLTDPLAGLALRAAAPAYAAGASLDRAVERFFADDRADRETLAKAVETLRKENAKLREQALENDALKLALHFQERASDAPILARVVSETDEDVFHGLVIDRGSDDGVRPGQAVVAGEGVIIGKVFEARRRSSSVLLLSDTKSRLAVAVQNASDTAGVLEGDRGLSMAIDLIPQNVDLSPGDIVVTSGIEPGIRRGLVVGTVEKVSKRTQDPFQTAAVVPFESAGHPLFVQVLGEAVVAAAN